MAMEKIFCRLGLRGHGPGNKSLDGALICKKCDRIYGVEDFFARGRYLFNIGVSFFLFICMLIVFGIYQFFQFVGGFIKFIFGA